jgi:hypothetical protein
LTASRVAGDRQLADTARVHGVAEEHQTRTAGTPLLVKVVIATAIVGALAWWLADRSDRRGNERRLAEIASSIAGRDVHVSCPGPLGRLLEHEIVDGSVRFDESGKPASETRLRSRSCGTLDAVAEGRRDAVLACLAAGGGTCGPEGEDVTRAVDVLAHESWHLAGLTDEAETECRALQSIAWVAQRLGASETEGRALARHHWEDGYRRMAQRYRSSDCADGGRLDLRPDSRAWP